MKKPAFALIVPLLAFTLLACSNDNDNDEAAAATPPAAVHDVDNNADTPARGGLTAVTQDLPDLVEQVMPSVVAVVVDQGEGSGVVWDADGHIITNNHVIQGAMSIDVVLASGERLTAELVAADPLTDLAVLRVEHDALEPADFDEELPRVGSLALAIGNPLGFESSVTLGIVSGLHRSIPSGGATPQLVDLIQTDAAISPGNSGGALLDLDGRVVGINVAYLPPGISGAVSIGFAIPAATVVDVVTQLLETGTVEHAFLGIEPRPVTPGIAAQLRLDVTEGVVVFGVSPGAAAEAAGMIPGDVIVEFAGTRLTAVEDLYTELRRLSPGDQVDIVVIRDGQEQTLQATLDDRPPMQP